MLPPGPAPDIVDSPVFVPEPKPDSADTPSPKSPATAPSFSHGLLPFVGWGCALVTFLWVATVSAPFFANALTLHGWCLAAALTLGLLPVALAAILLGFVLWRFHRVPDIPQIRETAPDNGIPSSSVHHSLSGRERTA